MFAKIIAPFVNVVQFFKDVYAELQRVVWPNHEETAGFTGVVIVAVAIIAVWVGLLDVIFTRLVGVLGLYD